MTNFKRDNNAIIEHILAEREKTQTEIKTQIMDNKTVIDSKTYFTDNSSEGIASKEQFVSDVNKIPKNQMQALTILLSTMAQGLKINTSPFAQTNKDGKEYYWLRIYGRNGSTEFGIDSFPGLDKLLQGYLFDLYHVTATFNDLYTEATS